MSSEIARFLVCGGAAAAINWLARIALSVVMPFPAAVALAYAIGMAAGFALYREVVWPQGRAAVAGQALRFLAVNALGALVTLAVAMLARAALSHALDSALAEAAGHAVGIAVGALSNFHAHARFTFARPVSSQRISS
ncbi:MAG: GtrA family protein [Rhizobiales bacterium]|nr:GtrA family protein [Hyphomicrobiales bacterium]